MSDLPHGWAVTPLAGIADVVRGVTYDKRQATSARREGCLPILRATNIHRTLDLESEMVFVPEEYVKPAQRMVQGDVVVATSSGSAGVVGKSAQLRTPWEGGFGAFCSVIRASNCVNARYLAHFVAGPRVRKVWRGLAQGTNINNLKTSDLTETTVPVPPRPEQDRIVAVIEEQFSRLDAAESALERVLGPLTNTQAGRIGALRASILTAAFAGRLVPQDLSDEPASILLAQIAADRAPSNGVGPPRFHKPRDQR